MIKHVLRLMIIWFVLLSINGIARPANELILETYIAVNKDNKRELLMGPVDVTFELISPTKNVVFKKSFSTTIVLGRLEIWLNKNDDFDPSVFTDYDLDAKLTISEQDLEYSYNSRSLISTNIDLSTAEVITLPINSNNQAVYANSAVSAKQLLNSNLISFNEPSLNIAIATSNHNDRLHVDGIVHAKAFVGDGSNFTNLDYIRWLKLYKRIYYNKGFVGMGLENPAAHLHVSGNLLVTQNTLTQSPALLIINNELISTFNGAAQQISDFNASNFTHGTIKNSQLFGNYPQLNGVGTLSQGTWIAGEIADPYIANNLTIVLSDIENGQIDGALTLTNDVTLESHTNLYPVKISPGNWAFHKDSSFNSIQASNNILTNTLFSYVSTLNIVNQTTPVLSINTSGNVSLTEATPNAKLALNSGIRIGNSSINQPGTIRLNQYFEGYSKRQGWQRLDMLGNFTGTSLFPENNIHSPVLKILSDGKISIHQRRPKDSFETSGNVVFTGNSNSAPISQSLETGSNFIWAAKKGALRIGDSMSSNAMNANQNIGKYSVGIGRHAIASGIGSIAISSPSENYATKTAGEYSVSIGSYFSNVNGDSSVVIGSNRQTIQGTSNVVLSAVSLGASISASNIVALNGNLGAVNYSNSIFGGKSSNGAIGQRSFSWDVTNTGSRVGNVDDSFFIGYGVKIGINTNQFNSSDASETIVVNGHLKATNFEGLGHLLTGNMPTSYMRVPINGTEQNIVASKTTSPNKIYVSTIDNVLNENTVNSLSLKNHLVEGVDIDKFSLDSHIFKDDSVINENFANAGIQTNHLITDSLGPTSFSNVVGENIEDNAIDETKLTNNSIYTYHFNDEAVGTRQIDINTINNPSNNIALHAITSKDIVVEELTKDYFARGSATGRTIATKALYTTTTNAGIDTSYFVWRDNAQPSPQIQEQHIQTGEVIQAHIPDNNISSRILGDKSIHRTDFQDSKTIADARTLTDPVFIGRHFVDKALTTAKFFDNCPSPTCSTPTENFQIESNQIDDNALRIKTLIGYNSSFFGTTPIYKYHNHIVNAAVTLNDIKDKNIVSRHIKLKSVLSSKFKDNEVSTRNIAIGAVTSPKITNGTIKPEDFAPKSIGGDQIQVGTIGKTQLATGSITSKNLGPDIISSIHIKNKSLGDLDFEPGAFTSAKIANGTVGSNSFKDNAIESKNISENIKISGSKFLDNGISWYDFIQPPDGIFPDDRIGDNQLDFDQKFDSSLKIDGEKLSTASVTNAKFAASMNDVDGIPQKYLMTPLMVPKGGTGITEFESNQILHVISKDDEIKMNQTPTLKWDPTGSKLIIGKQTIANNLIPNNLGLLTSGNILVEEGAVVVTRNADKTEYVFFKYNTTDKAIQMTQSSDLNSTETNLDLRTKHLYIRSELTIGDGITPANGIDLNTGFIIGYVTQNIPLIPNGLLIEESLQVGLPSKNIISQNSDIGDKPLIVDSGTTYGVSASNEPAILLDITGLKDADNNQITSPIMTFERSINAEGNDIGIEINPISGSLDVPLSISMKKINENASGMHLIMNNASNTTAGQIDLVVGGTTHETFLGKIDSGFNSAMYGKSLSTDEDDYSAYFEGNVSFEQLTTKAHTVTHNLTVDSLRVDGPTGFKMIDDVTITVDWRKGNVANIDVTNNDKVLMFTKPEQSAKLIVLINHTGKGKLTFGNADKISWLDNFPPELTATKDAVDIVFFNYDSELDKYFGAAAYNFKK